MSSRTFVVVISTVSVVAPMLVAACGPLPGYEVCRDKSDCADGQICVLTQGTARCANDPNAGEGEGALGEGEGASTGEGEGASTGEGEGASAGEGEGEGSAGSVVVTGPSVAPTGVQFTVRFDNTTGAADSDCLATVDAGFAVPVNGAQLDTTGAHVVTVTCGGVTSAPFGLSGWHAQNFAASAPASAAPATTTVTWDVDGGAGFDGTQIECAIHTHATSPTNAPADPVDTVIASGGAVPVAESSVVSATSCSHVSEPAILTQSVDIAQLDVAPATPTIAIDVDSGPSGNGATATVTTAGAETCAWFSVDGGFNIGQNDTRTDGAQTTFSVRITDADIGAGPASTFAVTCKNGASTSAPSASVVLHGGDVTDDLAVLAGVNVNLGSLHFTSATSSVDLEALTHVAGALAVDASDAAPDAFLAAALEQVTGTVSLDGTNTSTFTMTLGTSGGPPLVVGGLAVDADQIAAIEAPTLVRIDGDLDLANDTNLALFDAPLLASVGGTFHVVLDDLGCAEIASLFCALSQPRPQAIVQDQSGNDCASTLSSTCP